MNKLLIMIVCVFCVSSIQAQYDEAALKILDAMSEKYRKIPAYSATITSGLINENEGLNEQFNGKITVKGEMYHLELEEQIVINNGATVWTYLPDINEVNIDNYYPGDDEISPSKIYEAYKEGYKYLLVGKRQTNGVTVNEIDLIPNDRNAQFFKIKLMVAKNDYSLKSWAMYDKSGNKYTYSISDFRTDFTISDQYFTFDESKYPGVEIIDLR